MKKMLLLAVLALALPTAVFASSGVDYTNSGGTLSGTNSGLSLSGSVLVAVNGLNGGGLITGSNLGSLEFSTGALTSGSLQMGGTFAAGGYLHHHRERHQRDSERHLVHWIVFWSRDLDADHALQWNAQLHVERLPVGLERLRNGDPRCDRAVDDQYRQGFLQRQHEYLERRHEHRGS